MQAVGVLERDGALYVHEARSMVQSNTAEADNKARQALCRAERAKTRAKRDQMRRERKDAGFREILRAEGKGYSKGNQGQKGCYND